VAAVPKVGADEPTKQQGGRAEDALLAVANGGTAKGLQFSNLALRKRTRRTTQQGILHDA
jgi:hypothetical protein